MIDIDALVNALDKCYAQPETCGVSSCHYWNLRDPYCECIDRMHKDAIAILNGNEAAKPTTKPSGGWLETKNLWFCGACGARISKRKTRFCQECGRQVKW